MTEDVKAKLATPNADVFAPVRDMFLTIPRMQASGIELLLKQQKGVFEFLAHRCERDLEFVEQLSRLKDASGLPDIFSKFMQGASTDYAEEARKSVDAGSRAATELAEQLQEIQVAAPKLAA